MKFAERCFLVYLRGINMGNSNIKVTISYENKKEIIQAEHLQNFIGLIEVIKDLFSIQISTPIVIQMNQTFYSTIYKWPEEVKGNEVDLKVWNQVESSVRDCENTSQILSQIFKVQRPDGKILGLGLFISPDVCIVPRKFVDDNDIEEIKNNRIVFFNPLGDADREETQSEYDLNDALCVTMLGDHPANQNFILIHFKTGRNNWRIRLPSNTERIRGHVIYFNQNTHMLSSERTKYESINSSGLFALSYVNKAWLPGAIFISDESEIVGIYTGGRGNLFSTMNDTFKQMSEKLSLAIHNREIGIRDMILKVRGVELAIPEVSSILQDIVPFNNHRVEIVNPLSDLF